MRYLDGSELTGFIKERQAKQVRALRQSWRVFPKLAIVRTGSSKVTDTYLRLKQSYGEDILVDVDIHSVQNDTLLETVQALNGDESVHGIIIQLPLEDPTQTEQAIAAVLPAKDVDGLGPLHLYTPATAVAIDWLLAGYGIDLNSKKIVIIGNGTLVGKPLTELWRSGNYDVQTLDDTTENIPSITITADVLVTAAGVPGLVTPEMVKQKAIVVDAATSSESGKIVGDVADGVREREDLTITPVRGGVGPLTIAALFENVIQAARVVADASGQKDL